ncbi:DUF11 domain-containing protein [Nonomuraea deserti]|uniref:DUF11 domain-containing protein n=1 Tax=Nonomuraea deserti TaxID=1848322 RepID=A0A4R4VTG8_9ACTN|nr:DUF11 domain-containing protein [Nonomuraea deserti]TDD05974.1 DUF11 domain-containing protein [Nonomuraea deserti]
MARVAAVIALAALGGGGAAPAVAGGSAAGAPAAASRPEAGGSAAGAPAAVSRPEAGGPPRPPSVSEPPFRSGPPSASLRIGQAAVPDPLVIGGQAVYTVTVTNAGATAAEAVTITGTLDEHVAPGPLPDGCDLDGRTITCGGPALTIPAGRSVTRSFPVVIDPGLSDGTALTSRAEVSAAGAQGDSAQLVTEARAAMADVTITKAATLTAGGAIAYAVTVVNEGRTPATGVTVRHPAAGGATIADRPPECPGAGPALVCPLGTLAPSERRTFMFTLAPDEPGLVRNCATVSADGDEANTANNRSCTSTAVQRARAAAPDATPAPDEPAPAAEPSEEKGAARSEPRHEPRDAAPGERAGRHEPRSAAHDRAPRAEQLEGRRPLPMTGVSIWMLGLGTAVLLAIGLLVRYFSRRDRASGIP